MSKVGKRSKRGAVQLDKEAKETIEKLEMKIDEIRKASMNEINRLEAMMESESNEKQQRLTGFHHKVGVRLEDLSVSNNEIRGELTQVSAAIA